MGYRTGSRKSGERFQRSQHEKAKTKTHKHKDKSKLSHEETEVTVEKIVEKTLTSTKKLGEQRFAISPFSQYFDDWLINLKEVLAEFESSQAITVDETFVKERERIVLQVERELTELKQAEAALNLKVRELADNNHLLVELDADYAAKTRELGPRRNAEIERLTPNVKQLEEELERVKRMKTSIFSFTKKAKAKKEAETMHKLESAKAELERVLEKFKAEQEKLHDEYEKKKQATIDRVQELEKDVEKLETDTSATPRHDASSTLINAINALFQRKPASSPGPL